MGTESSKNRLNWGGTLFPDKPVWAPTKRHRCIMYGKNMVFPECLKHLKLVFKTFQNEHIPKTNWEFTCWASKTQGMGHNPWNPLISTWLGLMDVHHPNENVWVLVHSRVNKKQPTIYTATQTTTGNTQQHVYSRWQSTWLTSHIRNTSMIHRLIYSSIPRFLLFGYSHPWPQDPQVAMPPIWRRRPTPSRSMLEHPVMEEAFYNPAGKGIIHSRKLIPSFETSFFAE